MEVYPKNKKKYKQFTNVGRPMKSDSIHVLLTTIFAYPLLLTKYVLTILDINLIY